MKRILEIVVLVAVTSFIFISCASNNITRADIDLAYKEERYEDAENYLATKNKKGNQIDLSLDQAMLSCIKGDYKTSNSLLIDVYKQMELLSGELTAGQMVGAALSNEEAVKYSGPTYEFELLDSVTACNFIRLGDLDSARAMMRRSFNNNKDAFNTLKAKLQEIEKETESAGASAGTVNALKALKSSGVDYDFDSLYDSSRVESGEAEYELSPFIFYLGAVLFANDNEIDLAKDWCNSISGILDEDIVNSIVNIPPGMGSIHVVSLADTIVKRDESEYYVNILTSDDGLMLNFKLTWPSVPKSNNIVKNVRVTVSDDCVNRVVYSYLIEDFDVAVRNDVSRKADSAYLRSLIRNILRKSSAYVGGIVGVEIARATAEGLAKCGIPVDFAYATFYAAVAGLQLAMDTIDFSEHADRRQCSYFPSKARGANVVVAPGVYTVTVDYLDKAGNVVKSDVIPEVEVKDGIPSIVSSQYINSGNIYIPEEDGR